MIKYSLTGIIILFTFCCAYKPTASLINNEASGAPNKLKTGAEQTEKYLSYLKGKKIGIVSNKTSIIGKTHLVDSLHNLGINIVSVFGPEHGFRGNASAGTKVQDEIDSATGIQIILFCCNSESFIILIIPCIFIWK